MNPYPSYTDYGARCYICHRALFWHRYDCRWCPARRLLAMILFGWLP